MSDVTVSVSMTKKQQGAMYMENLRLKERLLALRKDAKRYQWLRERDNFPGDESNGPSLWDQLCELECDEFDQFIDAAMAEQEKPAERQDG